MKAAPVLTLTLVLITAVDARAASPEPAGTRSLAEARKALDAARDDLARAIQRIEKDPPTTEDLDAAHASVGRLKDAIDAGAQHEPNDLGYAKAALAARKELRTKREYVDQRRAKVHIFNHRRALDAALAKLDEQMRRVAGKQPSQKDFDDARAAAAAVKKTADEGRQFAKQDEAFAKYLAGVDATVERQEKAADDRWVQLSADEHRALVTQSRQGLASAMAALLKGRGDADFAAANRAATALSGRLEEGKPLEAKDKAYVAEAGKARKELAEAQKRMEQLLGEVGLERLKSEIEPAHRDLVAAGKALRARRPTEEQLGEARTAAIVVRKLVEKFQAQASLNKPFGQYVNEVSQHLAEVEVDLARRALDSARADLVAALRNVERRSATEEHFAEATTALTILEKTLEETPHKRDPVLLKPVADAREWVRNAKATLTKRRLEVDVQRQRAKVQDARKSAEEAVRQIQQPDPGEERLKEAEKAVFQLAAAVEEGAPFARKDRDYALFARDLARRVGELNERIARRRIAVAAGEGRSRLSGAVDTAKAKLETAGQPQSTDADIDAASKSVDALTQVIEAGEALEKQDAGYAASAERAREQVVRLSLGVELARAARAIRKETAEALSAGVAAAKAGDGSRDLRTQKVQYEKALARFKSCDTEGSRMIKDDPALAKVAVLVDGTPGTAKDVVAQCAERTKATEQQLRQVMSILGFEDGPKRSYEAGKVLLAKARKSEALPHFAECISSGKIHQYRYPELKDRKFPVAGGKMSLPELIERCVNQRKALLQQK